MDPTDYNFATGVSEYGESSKGCGGQRKKKGNTLDLVVWNSNIVVFDVLVMSTLFLQQHHFRKALNKVS